MKCIVHIYITLVYDVCSFPNVNSLKKFKFTFYKLQLLILRIFENWYNFWQNNTFEYFSFMNREHNKCKIFFNFQKNIFFEKNIFYELFMNTLQVWVYYKKCIFKIFFQNKNSWKQLKKYINDNIYILCDLENPAVRNTVTSKDRHQSHSPSSFLLHFQFAGERKIAIVCYWKTSRSKMNV